ncbi:hypothetical protein M406DRAFT_243332, partial [Cryphonectria parasitica EP155]
SKENLLRCMKCIKHKYRNCNIYSLLLLQVEKIIAQYSAAEAALDNAEKKLERATAKI